MDEANDKSLLEKFYEKGFEPNKDETADSESSSDEDFVCGSSQTDNSNTSSSVSDSEDQTDDENDQPNNHNESKVESDSKSKIKKSPPTLKFPNKSETTKKKREYCCICLDDDSSSTDELVACDSCGFLAHEGCYGITDSDSLLQESGGSDGSGGDSVASSATTDPWFCNLCCLKDDFKLKTSGDEVSCELCPNVRCGLMKETNTGKFVHIVCALYTPGVTFQDTEKLWPVVLSEIPSIKWGERHCSLCDNLSFSRTGVCIECDAGLCKTYFHVTCAQKYGLLTDPNQQETDDCFFGHCKQHKMTKV
jgi:hypothetical protein